MSAATELKQVPEGWRVTRTFRNLPAASRAVEQIAAIVEEAYEPVTPREILEDLASDDVPLRAGGTD